MERWLGRLVDPLYEVSESRVRSKTEYAFFMIKRVFGYLKVRYRGLAKNLTQVNMLCAVWTSTCWLRLSGAGVVSFGRRKIIQWIFFGSDGRFISNPRNFCHCSLISGYLGLQFSATVFYFSVMISYEDAWFTYTHHECPELWEMACVLPIIFRTSS